LVSCGRHLGVLVIGSPTIQFSVGTQTRAARESAVDLRANESFVLACRDEYHPHFAAPPFPSR
jgi:hypothetical protein